MHTAICAFDSRARAEEARDSLVRSGFARHDVHIEHKHGDKEAADTRWDGLEREVAVDPGVLKRFGHFFDRLFGKDNAAGHADKYSQHVERGSYVVVVDTADDAEAQRAHTLLQSPEAIDLTVVYRVEQMPLRDIVGMRQEDMSPAGTAGMVDRSSQPYESTQNNAANLERERAMASRDPRDDVTHAPGLRYSDKDDKPM
jgi:hypothetical protein